MTGTSPLAGPPHTPLDMPDRFIPLTPYTPPKNILPPKDSLSPETPQSFGSRLFTVISKPFVFIFYILKKIFCFWRKEEEDPSLKKPVALPPPLPPQPMKNSLDAAKREGILIGVNHSNKKVAQDTEFAIKTSLIIQSFFSPILFKDLISQSLGLFLSSQLTPRFSFQYKHIIVPFTVNLLIGITKGWYYGNNETTMLSLVVQHVVWSFAFSALAQMAVLAKNKLPAAEAAPAS